MPGATTEYDLPYPLGTESTNGPGAIKALAEAVEAVLVADDPSAWTAVTFTNSWVNFGGTDQVAQYRKVGDVVELRGSIKTGTIGNAAFTLPSGFRPPADTPFGVESNAAHGRVTITSAGVVTPDVGNTARVVLNGIRFSVTA